MSEPPLPRPDFAPAGGAASGPLPAVARACYHLSDLRHWRDATAGVAPALRLAVAGDPVTHSLSPLLHNAALSAAGLPVAYTRLHVSAGELAAAWELLVPAGFLGVNLTIPHKVAALTLVDVLDAGARRLGAVNTVRITPDGRREGFNTDGPGFVRSLRAAFGERGELRGRRVLILGAGGGAGRALAVQCALAGCGGLVLANRTGAKARALAEQLRGEFPGLASVEDCRAVAWEEIGGAAAGVDLVVNATSLGLRPDDPPPLRARELRPDLMVFDSVYRSDQAPTVLVAAARQAGAAATDGRGLLLHQGALAFELWFERPAPLARMARGAGFTDLAAGWEEDETES